MTWTERALIPGALATACIAVYWYALTSWLFLDDFAWIQLPLGVHSAHDLWIALFEPRAQGTVRVLSERLPFLVSGSLFGVHVWPFRLLTFGTQFVNLALVASIGRRLGGSTLAGAAAACFWLFSEALATPMAWASGYNEILWAFVLLLSFRWLLKYIDTGDSRYWKAQWVLYLLGFGVLELNVMYPAVVLLYLWLFAREHVRKGLWLIVPALLFSAIYYAIVPSTADPTYRMYFDSDLVRSFYRLLSRSVGPIRLGEIGYPQWTTFGIGATAAIASGLLCFAVFRILRRDRLPLFLLGWFVITIAPLVPLKNQVVDYYPAVPSIGLALLGGYAFASAWKSGLAPRIIAIVLAVLYCGGNCAEIREETKWRRDNSRRLQAVLRGAERIHRMKPRTTVLLDGVDWDLFAAGFGDRPFRLFGMPEVYILPETMESLQKQPPPLRNLDLYQISEKDAHVLLARGEAIALSLGNVAVFDTTDRYQAVYQKRPLGEFSRVNAGDPAKASNLGGDWYAIENGFRWMGRSATVRLAGPESKGQHLAISGFAPRLVLASGPLHLSVSVDGSPVGQALIENAEAQFGAEFALPDRVVGKAAITVGLSLDRTTSLPSDARQLGVIFGQLAIR
jgi:hypothetical protein